MSSTRGYFGKNADSSNNEVPEMLSMLPGGVRTCSDRRGSLSETSSGGWSHHASDWWVIKAPLRLLCAFFESTIEVGLEEMKGLEETAMLQKAVTDQTQKAYSRLRHPGVSLEHFWESKEKRDRLRTTLASICDDYDAEED
ncbi:hypothetical protein Patl1_34879 [Pistacia atlantica]|uniref:Uncharacterized protein n=1 Tax=Pistacia atlantica TaxID=434234 RepID=A0ACC0ZT71_9ROSI|nr:hypothetical protein Patl1_34879 [Pistacia atlantica]